MLLLLILANLGTPSMGAEFAAMPTINVRQIPFDDLRIGDVICFNPLPEVRYHFAAGTKTVCHRIFWRNQTIAFTWGDANKYPDYGYVNAATCLGKVYK